MQFMSQFCWENCIRKKQVVAEPGSKRSTQVDVCTGEGTAAQNSRVLELFLCPCRQWSQHLAESRDPGDQPDHLQPAAVRTADATHDVCGDPDGRCGCVPGRQAVRQHWFGAVSRSCSKPGPLLSTISSGAWTRIPLLNTLHSYVAPWFGQQTDWNARQQQIDLVSKMAPQVGEWCSCPLLYRCY